MRPLKLRLANFTCFRGDTTELDFSGLELFAIAGPTGAGKSSLLDAIIFALYGAVPRMRRGFAEMISLGADRMSVVFDFRVGATSYRVTRIARRRGAGNTQLEELGLDGVVRPLKDGAREVNEEIVRVLGLTYDAFTQAVVLPQGEFQRFLKSQAGERREILSKILRLEIYEQMRQLASSKRDGLARGVEERERRLNEDYADATPAALDGLNDQSERLRAEIQTLSSQLGEVEARRDVVRVAREKTRDLEQRRSRFLQLQADEPHIRAYEAQLEGARRAAPVLPLIRHLRAAVEQAGQAKRTYEAAVADHARLQGQRGDAKGRLDQVTKDAEEVPVLESRIAALDQVLGRMRPRPKLLADLAEYGRQRTNTDQTLKGARSAHQKGEGELVKARQNFRDAEGAVVRAGFDPNLFEKLDATREDLRLIAELRTACAKGTVEAQTAMGQLYEKDAAVTRSAAAAAAAEGAWRRTSQRMLELDQERAEARHRAMAAVLRKDLHIGEPCPVCEHPVGEHPPALKTPELDALDKTFNEARGAEAEARGITDKAKTAIAEATAAIVAARQIADEAAGRQSGAAAKLAGACKDLEERVRGHVALASDRPIEEQVHEAYAQASASRLRQETARKAKDEAERLVQTLVQRVEQLNGTMTALASQLDREDERVAELAAQIAEIDAEVRKITEAPDPEAERNELNSRRAGLDNELRISQAADAKAMADLSGAVARLEASKETHENAESTATGVRAEAGAAAIAAGFPDLEAAAAAELNSADEQQFATLVETHRREWRSLETRISELVGELDGEETPEETLLAAEAAVTELRDGLRIAEASHAALNERIAALTAAVERAGRLREELEKQRAEQSVYHSLALDLRSDRFQAFLLEETFRELVSGASVRLWDLTARYRFEWLNEAFFVIDYDNARQARSVDTLSGGETFLASLALALQLSEQVQKAAGATMLDSLFIDEGFGTLDPEALDAAAGAIETLPIGGRMVGIISHIEELSLRLPARVRVKKGGESSQVTVEASQ